MKKLFLKLLLSIIIVIKFSDDTFACDRALKAAIDQRSVKLVRILQQNPQCSTHAKLAMWLALKESFKSVQFSDYQQFLDHNQSWPWQHKLIAKAEILADQAPQALVLKWFKKHPPETGAGVLNYLKACHITTRQNMSAQHLADIRRLWVNTSFSAAQENEFLQHYKIFLRPHDHCNRARLLLNKEDITAAQRLKILLPSDYWVLIQARIAFKTLQDDALIHYYVGQNHISDSDLLLDHLHWLRKRRDPHASEFLLVNRAKMLNQPVRLWKETHILIRRAFENNDFQQALDLVSNHGLKPGSDYFEAEWLRGWLVLKFLKKPHTAQKIFQDLHITVKTSISLAKTAYWAGVASQKCDDSKTAYKWLNIAACYPTTFYGQIAAYRLKKTLKLINMSMPNLKIQQQFNNRELVKVLKILKSSDLHHHCRDFLYILVKNIPDAERILVVQLAKQIDPNYMVSIARLVPVISNIIVEDSYPFLPIKVVSKAANVNPALMHAVIRKESSFDHNVISPAGAIGLMQVMPDTARKLMKSLQIKSDARVNLADPNFNVYLGSTYLARQLQNYDGSVIMALAAYNAGPKWVADWVQYFGDPRHKDIDVIDWIEMIPFGETRNYVQRVIEVQEVYQMIIQARQLMTRPGKKSDFKKLKRSNKIVKRKF